MGISALKIVVRNIDGRKTLEKQQFMHLCLRQSRNVFNIFENAFLRYFVILIENKIQAKKYF